MSTICPGVFFTPRAVLPRGRHALDRAAAEEAQRERLMAAFAELVADDGLAGVTVTDVVARAGVSRAAFYASFDDLAGCGDAAYERFITVLLDRLTTAMEQAEDWADFLTSTTRAYLGALEADPVVARAMQIEMDAAGSAARARRRRALRMLADIFKARHEQLRAEDRALGPLPDEAHLGALYAVRQMACDALDEHPRPDLSVLIEPTVRWIEAGVLGAAHVAEPATHRFTSKL